MDIGNSAGLMNTLYHSDFGIILFIVSLVGLYLIPLVITG